MYSFRTMIFSLLAILFLSTFVVSYELKQQPRVTPLSYAKIRQELKPRLTREASLYFPPSPSYKNYTDLWSESAIGDIIVVVVPAADSDVAETVSL